MCDEAVNTFCKCSQCFVNGNVLSEVPEVFCQCQLCINFGERTASYDEEMYELRS